MKTFSTLGLKPQAQEKEKDKENKKESAATETNSWKRKSKPSAEGKEKKKRRKRSLFPIPEERRTSKKIIIRLVKESPSSSRAEDEVFAIGADTAATPTAYFLTYF